MDESHSSLLQQRSGHLPVLCPAPRAGVPAGTIQTQPWPPPSSCFRGGRSRSHTCEHLSISSQAENGCPGPQQPSSAHHGALITTLLRTERSCVSLSTEHLMPCYPHFTAEETDPSQEETISLIPETLPPNAPTHPPCPSRHSPFGVNLSRSACRRRSWFMWGPRHTS